MKRLDAMALLCLAAMGLGTHSVALAGPRGRPVDPIRLHKAIEQIQNLKTLSGEDFHQVQIKLAGRLGGILRDLGVEGLLDASERSLGYRVIRERRAVIDALARSGKLSQESAETFVPILNELSALRPIGKRPLEERITGAVEQARKLSSSSGADFRKIQAMLAGRLGRILRDVGVEAPRGSGDKSVGRKLIRERKTMIDALAASGKLSQASVEILAPIVNELSLLREIVYRPNLKSIDERIAVAARQARELHGLDGKEFTKMHRKLAARLGRILRDFGVEVPPGSNEQNIGHKLIRERKAMIDGLVLSGKLSQANAESLTPILEQLSLLRLIVPKERWTPYKSATNTVEAERKLRVWQILNGILLSEGQKR